MKTKYNQEELQKDLHVFLPKSTENEDKLNQDTEWLEKKIYEAETAQSYHLALDYYDRLIAIKPNDYTLWNNHAYILNKLTWFQQAALSAIKAISLDPQEPNAWRHLGNAFFGLKNHQNAKTSYLEAVRLKPNYADAWVDLGDLHLLENQYNEAIFAYHQALVINPSLTVANEGVKQAISLGQAIDFNKILINAAMFGLESSLLLALSHGETLLAKTTDEGGNTAAHIAAKYGHMECLRILLHHDNSLLETLNGLNQTPLHCAAFHGRVQCVRLLLEFNANVNCVSTSGNTPFHEAALSYKSTFNVSKKDTIECLRLLIVHKADTFAVNKDNKTAYQLAKEEIGWSKVLAFINKEMHDQVKRMSDEAYELSEQGKHRDAIKNYNWILGIMPYEAVIWNNKAYEWNQIGQYDAAIACSTRAIELAPKYANPWRHLGNAYFKLKEYREALRCYDHALQLKPNYKEAQAGMDFCQRIIDELDSLESIRKHIHSKVEQYTKLLEKKIRQSTIRGVTFFYNKELSDEKIILANNMIGELNSLATTPEAKQLLQQYLAYDRELIANYNQPPATFSNLLTELTEDVDKLQGTYKI